MKLKKLFLLFMLIPMVLNASEKTAFETLKGYAYSDKGNLFYNYAFDIANQSVNSGISIWGLTRHRDNPVEIDIIYGMNAIVNLMLLKRSFSILGENGLFYDTYLKVEKIKDPRSMEMIAQYRLQELSNSVRQLRKITSYFGIVSAILIASFSEGRGTELASSAFIFSNSIFYLFFYDSYGEDAYDKYFYFKKAFPEIAFTDKSIKFGLTLKF